MNTVNIYGQVSYGCSRLITSTYSSSFSSAIRLLHADLRAQIYGIYGFVRVADEIVDSFHDYDKRALLTQFKADTYRAIEEGISTNPILHSFQQVVNRYHIGHHLIDAFFDSMFTDLDKVKWENEKQLSEYIYGSAEVVGLMCLQVFCDGNYYLVEKLRDAATALGAAFQKVNFLRDLQDDINGLGRQYFPGIDFNNFTTAQKKLVEADILADFERAAKGIHSLPEKARFGVLIAYQYYICLFQKITKIHPHRLLSRRVSVPKIKKIALVLQLLMSRLLKINRWQLSH
ncbi:phytoene/squalene synthase family protein [Chitinophaga pendula]|uniref:phytoene/squalene synthase family protein n=1 Tax=Chitinophaga TaxID=79328 RepID=UPI000BAF9C9C|nr:MULTISPECIES: phytoene/squalene synthase family protein [Chitinophaga]ASZ12109.1 phytoene synthase [Chitinophaga sp. MD30]UCJ04855.1 phytoene/squalene synthase family protein [Chitinophaga pendula]